MAHILRLPDEILEGVLALVTKPVKPEYTRESDGCYPNGETQYKVGLLRLVCKRFYRIAVKGHFQHHAHHLALHMETDLVDGADGPALARRAVILPLACTFVPYDHFFCANTKHIEVFAQMSNVLEVQLMMRKVRVMLLAFAAITTGTLDKSMTDVAVRAMALNAMHTIVDEAEQRPGAAIQLRFEML